VETEAEITNKITRYFKCTYLVLIALSTTHYYQLISILRMSRSIISTVQKCNEIPELIASVLRNQHVCHFALLHAPATVDVEATNYVKDVSK
jgi:CHASE3 domain sensor protein